MTFREKWAQVGYVDRQQLEEGRLEYDSDGVLVELPTFLPPMECLLCGVLSEMGSKVIVYDVGVELRQAIIDGDKSAGFRRLGRLCRDCMVLACTDYAEFDRRRFEKEKEDVK